MSSTHDDPPHLTSSKANNNSSAKVAGIPVLTPPGPDTNFLSWWYVVRGYLASIELSYVLDPTNQKTAPPRGPRTRLPSPLSSPEPSTNQTFDSQWNLALTPQ
ncbi:hypothetical protein PSHT_10173 [Puccinia striiformis]|uniref:Uncharacterized protein n=1 Tax=Puccinia striiformis TaxID=27350 RepID=A0A2S4VBE7_9BASI|nr:hypothetical protein KEM48_003028 [Puccinia striiformis f. sp. tritici PST-130]POW06872.1 hypothetical protein PSHT_10173 [Puccinia striiformis]